MSDSMPYLGSKISLISKSEIRYEGILYTIDAQESIIALAKVQSFGTEDRPVPIPVPAKSDIYEYIIFRGTDIKKIEVCETAKPSLSVGLHDPAIVGLQQHAIPPPVQPSYSTSSFNRPQLGPIGSLGGPYYGGYGQHLGQQNLSTGSNFPLGVSQTSELSTGIGGSVALAEGGIGNSLAGNIGELRPGNSQSGPAPIGAPLQSRDSSTYSHKDVLTGSRSSTPSATRKSPVSDAGVQVSPPHQPDKGRPPPKSAPSYQERERTTRQGTQMNNQAPRRGGSQGQGGQGIRSNSQDYQGYYQNQHQYPSGRGTGMNRGRNMRRPPLSKGRGGYNQNTRQIFDKEFDFEQGNVQFEELRTQLAKTKISDTEKKDEKKDDSGHETATTGDESEDSANSIFYDKTKSFFDSISCEAIERSKGRSQRPDWRQERKINVQTFGVAAPRRGYYSRGGRGNYYNRGGYYGNYNQGYYRNSNSNYRGGYTGQSGNTNNKNASASFKGPTESSSSASYASAVRNSAPTLSASSK